MTAVHHESMRIEESFCYQRPESLRGGYRRDLKVRAVLVGKEAVEDMIALMRTGCRHVDAPPGIAVEVASDDPNQRDGPLQIVVPIERIEVSPAILIGVVSRRG